MFTIDQIKAAHSKVQSGADFPAYIADLKVLGVAIYTTWVTDGHTDYKDNNSYTASSPAMYSPLLIADIPDTLAFGQHLKEHQQGKSDYMTFCSQTASNGVEKWIVDTQNMTCTYYDKTGSEVLQETIPSV